MALSLGPPQGGCGRLIEVLFPILFYNYFRTLITGCLIEGGCLTGGLVFVALDMTFLQSE